MTSVAMPKVMPAQSDSPPDAIVCPWTARCGVRTASSRRDSGCGNSIAQGQQRCIAAGRGGVDRDRAFGSEAQQVVGSAGLGSGTGEVLAAEGLHPDDRADLVAVDVTVADPGAFDDVIDGVVDAA